MCLSSQHAWEVGKKCYPLARKAGAERVKDAPRAWWEAVAEIEPMACLCTLAQVPHSSLGSAGC